MNPLCITLRSVGKYKITFSKNNVVELPTTTPPLLHHDLCRIILNQEWLPEEKEIILTNFPVKVSTIGSHGALTFVIDPTKVVGAVYSSIDHGILPLEYKGYEILKLQNGQHTYTPKPYIDWLVVVTNQPVTESNSLLILTEFDG